MRSPCDFEKALHCLEEATRIAAISRDSTMAYADHLLDQCAPIYYEMGLVDKAIEVIREAIQLCEENMEIASYRRLRFDAYLFYIAGGYYAKDKGIRELQQEMEEYLSWGAKAVKMKVGLLSMKEDADRVRAVREVIGEDTLLMMDANCSYRAFEAIQFAAMVEQYHPYWFEEPVEQDDYDGYRKIAEKCGIPIAAGENEMTRFGLTMLSLGTWYMRDAVAS